MSEQKLKIRDLTLRDGQQSQLATRMNQSQIDRVLPLFQKAGFWAMEVWGGAVPDSVMRYLEENPWTRLEKIKDGIAGKSKLTALSRGRNLFGYNPYPEDVIKGFNKNAVESGIDIMRIFDALNDINNMKSTISVVKECGGSTDCCICYTVDPTFSWKDRLRSYFGGPKVPAKIFDTEYFVSKAEELESLGADIITIKDMAGLIDPHTAKTLITALKQRIKIPIDLHTHSTPGYGLASVLVSIMNGVDIVDTVIAPFAGGPAAPAFELVARFCDKLGITLSVDYDAIKAIRKELYTVRKELDEFDQYKLFPKDIDSRDTLPPEIDALFDDAIKAIRSGDLDRALIKTQAIEKWWNFPAPNEVVREAQIPGGMYTNMLAQLQVAGLSDLLPKVLKTVPRVRLDAGIPPLVTPTSQIVGIQAVSSVVSERSGKSFYKQTSIQFVNLVKGSYGATPFPVNPSFREQITGVAKEQPYSTENYQKQENPTLPECGGVSLAIDEKEELLLELFPAVAKGFLSKQRKKEYNGRVTDEIRAERVKVDAAQHSLMEGLTGDYQGE
ncbi:carboxylase [bacterium]|nr:carboxylase [bacterium]